MKKIKNYIIENEFSLGVLVGMIGALILIWIILMLEGIPL